MWFLVGTLSGWFVKQVFDFYLMEVEALLEAPLMLHSCLVEWKYCFFFLHVCVCSNAHTIIFYASVTVREFWIFPPDSVVNTHRHTHRICHMCADVSSFPLTVAISVLPYHSLSFLHFFAFPQFFSICVFFYSFPSSTFYFHLSLCESSPCHSSIPHQQRAERAGHPCWDTLWSEQPVTPREVCLLDNYTRTANVTVTEEELSLRLCFVFLQL